MRYLGGHLGVAVSALLDGQLDPASTERAWAHVRACALCDRQVHREGWVKTQLASMNAEAGPPPQLLGSLYGLGEGAATAAPADPGEEARAWAAVHELERRGRSRRRAGIALAGAGSVSVAVLGLAGLTGSTLGIGSAPTGSPTTSVSGPRADTATTAVVAPSARVHGRLPGGSPRPEGPSAAGRSGGGEPDLQR